MLIRVMNPGPTTGNVGWSTIKSVNGDQVVIVSEDRKEEDVVSFSDIGLPFDFVIREVLKILSQADGGCPVCVSGLVEEFRKNFGFQITDEMKALIMEHSCCELDDLEDVNND